MKSQARLPGLGAWGTSSDPLLDMGRGVEVGLGGSEESNQ